MPEIGATLREARMRARIDVSEIEAQTKIRAKYLRALENEEWDLLPGPTFVQELPAHLRPGAGSGRQGAGGGLRLNYERSERGGARADRLGPARARQGQADVCRRDPRADTWRSWGSSGW